MNLSQTYTESFEEFKKNYELYIDLFQYYFDTKTYLGICAKNWVKRNTQLKKGLEFNYHYVQDSAVANLFGLRLNQYREILKLFGAFNPFSTHELYFDNKENCERAINYLYIVAYSMHKGKFKRKKVKGSAKTRRRQTKNRL